MKELTKILRVLPGFIYLVFGLDSKLLMFQCPAPLAAIFLLVAVFSTFEILFFE